MIISLYTQILNHYAKNGCFWTVVLEKTLESPLDCKEIQPVHSKGDLPWVFFGRNDTKAETPGLWPPHAKSWFIGKDSDAGRDWGQEEKGMTEDEMAGWHHWLDGREFEWTPGDGDGQGGLACWNLSLIPATGPFWGQLAVTAPSVHFSGSVVSDSLQPCESQHARPPCPSPSLGVHSDSHPSRWWCHPAISSSVFPFSSCPQSLPASKSFPMSQLFTWGGQSTGVSALASFLPKKSQGWSLQWIG